MAKKAHEVQEKRTPSWRSTEGTRWDQGPQKPSLPHQRADFHPGQSPPPASGGHAAPERQGEDVGWCPQEINRARNRKQGGNREREDNADHGLLVNGRAKLGNGAGVHGDGYLLRASQASTSDMGRKAHAHHTPNECTQIAAEWKRHTHANNSKRSPPRTATKENRRACKSPKRKAPGMHNRPRTHQDQKEPRHAYAHARTTSTRENIPTHQHPEDITHQGPKRNAHKNIKHAKMETHTPSTKKTQRHQHSRCHETPLIPCMSQWGTKKKKNETAMNGTAPSPLSS